MMIYKLIFSILPSQSHKIFYIFNIKSNFYIKKKIYIADIFLLFPKIISVTKKMSFNRKINKSHDMDIFFLDDYVQNNKEKYISNNEY